jgi:S1-C subfamily serine protease
LSPALAEELAVAFLTEGVALTSVERNSIATRNDLREGDVILAVDGSKVSYSRELARILARPKSSWLVTLNRSGRVLTRLLNATGTSRHDAVYVRSAPPSPDGRSIRDGRRPAN